MLLESLTLMYNNNKIVTRHCVNPDILIRRHNLDGTPTRSWNYQEFSDMVNFWKVMLVEKYDPKPGQKAFVYGTPGIHYYTALFAAIELGLVMIIDWPHCRSEEDFNSYKVNMFGKLDFVITEKIDFLQPNHPEFRPWEHARNTQLTKTQVYFDELDTYTIQDNSRYEEIANRIVPKPGDIMLEYCSSGTTGTPKKLHETHQKIYRMAERLGKYFGYKADDKCLHTNNIHHGASLCYYWLPTFMICREHYSQDPSVLLSLDWIRKEKINQMFLYHPSMLLSWLVGTKPVDHEVNIVTLYQITKEVAGLMKEKNITSVQTSFGDTSIGLGFFIKKVTQDTDLASYNVTNMGPQLDDNFFLLEVRNGLLYISCPEMGEDWRTSDDVFDLIDGNFYFKGRANLYRINNEWISLNQLTDKVNQLFGENKAAVVVDADAQKLYLGVWEENPEAEQKFNEYLESTWQLLRLSYVLRGYTYDDFYNSRKIDNSKIRDYCRTRLGLSS